VGTPGIAGPFQPCLATLIGLTWAVAALFTGNQAFGCAACGCSLGTDGPTGLQVTPGWRLDLQFDYINQDQLRHGSGTITPDQVAALNSASTGTVQEVEHQTINRYTTLGLTYAPDTRWSFKLLVPIIDRSHSTYGPATSPVTSGQLSSATVTGLGDVKFLASYLGLLPDQSLGIQFGVKLPTGNYGGQNGGNGPVVGRNPVSFGPGGNSGGMLLDTSLQAGTGSTDLILGGHYFRPVSENLNAYVTVQFQAAVKERLNQSGSDFRPGNQENLSLGLRYESDPRVVPQFQVNLVHKGPDQGALADTEDTAGTVAYLSPGVNVNFMSGLQTFAFVQLPVVSNLAGYQLFPRWTASVGVAYHF
jgi:hypothetical protein